MSDELGNGGVGLQLPYSSPVPRGLERFYGCGNLHFITCSCYRRLPLLNDPERYDAFLDKLESVRASHGFVVVAYVLMPKHFDLLIGERNGGTPSSGGVALRSLE